MTLLVLLQARNEQRFLPGWLANVADIVDGIVALDDGSDDATAEILSAHPKVIELIRKPYTGQWDERGNHMALIKAGRRHGASWFLCIDADERVELPFGPKVADLIVREDVDAYSLRLRELWGDRRHYRTDGIWGSKARYRLFRNNPEHRKFDPRLLHRSWMPLEILASLERAGRHSGLNLYHLGMLSPEDRAARHARYKRLDPESRFQAQGYDYLIDETGLQLATVPKERDFVPLCDPALAAPVAALMV
jgi:glycosyltransferase involved in cell wall biosynthesis